MKTLYVPLTVDSNIGFLLWDSFTLIMRDSNSVAKQLCLKIFNVPEVNLLEVYRGVWSLLSLSANFFDFVIEHLKWLLELFRILLLLLWRLFSGKACTEVVSIAHWNIMEIIEMTLKHTFTLWMIIYFTAIIKCYSIK